MSLKSKLFGVAQTLKDASENGNATRAATSIGGKSKGSVEYDVLALDRDAQTAFKSKAREAGLTADRYVKRNPWQSIAIASVASFCVAALIVGTSMATMIKKFGNKG